MDYTIFNVHICDHSYACIYIWGLVTPTVSQHNIFYSEKLSQIVLVLLTVFEPDGALNSLDLEAVTLEPPRHPRSTAIFLYPHFHRFYTNKPSVQSIFVVDSFW